MMRGIVTLIIHFEYLAMLKIQSTFISALLFCSAVTAQEHVIEGAASTFILNYSTEYAAEQINVMNNAAAFWADTVNSGVPIEVTIGVDRSKFCSFAYNSFLATQVPASVVNFSNAPYSNISYPVALANAMAGTDLLPSAPDIEIKFNRRNVYGSGGCLKFYLEENTNFNPFTHVNLYWETVQELAHGLGLFPLTDFKTGALAQNVPDIYTSYVRSVLHGDMVHNLSIAELYNAATTFHSLTFTGPKALAYAQANFSTGIIGNGVSLYSSPYYNRETIAAHFSNLVETPSALRLHISSSGLPDTGISLAMLEDIGWQIGSNAAPVITGQQSLTVNEDTQLSLSLNDLVLVDENPNNLTVQIDAGAHYQVNGQVITPNADYVGELVVPVRVNDGEFTSNTFNLVINVLNVNDAPTITAQVAISTLEEQPVTLSTAMLTILDVDSSTFTLSVLPANNYSVMGTTILPAENFYGELRVPVQVSDGEASSPIFYLNVQVQATNDAPVIQSQNPLQWQEDSRPAISTSWVNFTDIDSNQFSLQVMPGDHYIVTGQTLTLEENYAGLLSIPVSVFDGIDSSNLFTVTATVTPVNDAPVLSSIASQEIFEDNSFFITQTLLTIADPDSDVFSVNIGLGEHYQVAGNEIIPNANWFGLLSIPVSVSDGELTSQTQTFVLNVLPVNDLPELTTSELTSVAIYREQSQQLSASDIDSDTVSFSLESAPTWLSLSSEGLLTAFPDYQAVGEWPVTIKLFDGESTISEVRTLTVLDDPTATDLSVEAIVERNIWGLDAWVPVEVIVQNLGPMASVTAPLTIDFNGEWQSQDARCTPALNRCELSVTDASSVKILIKQTTAGSSNLKFNWQHEGFEINDQNNSAMLTLMFTDVPITSPQFTVPNFGQGTVRAIALANIQGGRWPEVMFANGPTEASTAYRFEKSLFRPVLHAHLSDASDSYAMALVDIDNDGDKDWILANGHGEPNTVYLNNGAGQFSLHALLGNRDSRAVRYADMDRDGDIDLLFANNEDNNTLYLNDGAGNFSLVAEFPARRSRGVIIFDFNGDGYPDILFANHGHRNRIFFNRGFKLHSRSLTRSLGRSVDAAISGEFSFDELEFGNAEDLTSHVALADLNGDGIASDVILINDATENQNSQIQILAINTNESTTLKAEKQGGSVTDLSIGDYDGDGKDDIAVLHPGGALEVMSDQLSTIEVMDTRGADSILLVDVDGSGTADVISANSRAGESRLDFVGEVTNTEDITAGSTAAVALPDANNITPVTRPSLSAGGSKSGSMGLVLLLVGILLIMQRRVR
jgi:hypothetical protein